MTGSVLGVVTAIYVYDVDSYGKPPRSVGGVEYGDDSCTVRAKAKLRLSEALMEAPPGTQGTLRRAHLPADGKCLYKYDDVVVRGCRDEATGEVRWSR